MRPQCSPVKQFDICLICINTDKAISATLLVNPEIVMSEKIKSEMISRRGAFSLLGVAAALSLVVPATMMTATEAEAAVGNPGSAVSVAGANRRDRRQDRRSKKKKKKPTDSEEKK
jgi:hypothetical protein